MDILFYTASIIILLGYHSIRAIIEAVLPLSYHCILFSTLFNMLFNMLFQHTDQCTIELALLFIKIYHYLFPSDPYRTLAFTHLAYCTTQNKQHQILTTTPRTMLTVTYYPSIIRKCCLMKSYKIDGYKLILELYLHVIEN